MSADRILSQVANLFALMAEQGQGQAPAFQSQFLRTLRHDGLALDTTRVLPAVCLSTDKAGANVYVTGYSSSWDAPTVATCDPRVPGKTLAIGQIVVKLSDTTCLVSVQGASEMPWPGLTVGALYVVGTNGLPAKSGDSNYPSVGAVITVLGPAISTTRILLLRNAGSSSGSGSSGVGASGLIGTITSMSSVLTPQVVSDPFDRTITIPAGTFVPGDVMRVKGRVRCVSSPTNEAMNVRVFLGTSQLFVNNAVNPNQDERVIFDITMQVLSATSAMVTTTYINTDGAVLDGSTFNAIAIVTNADQVLSVTARGVTGGTDTFRLESLAVWKN